MISKIEMYKEETIKTNNNLKEFLYIIIFIISIIDKIIDNKLLYLILK